MTTSNRFDAKDPGEDDIVLTFDFSQGLLGVGQSLIGTPTVSVRVVRGVDPNPNAILAGGNTIDSTGMLFQVPVIGGLDGVDYDVVVRAHTTNPSKPWQVLGGVLPVRAQ